MNRTLGAAISACLSLVGCVAPTQYGGPIPINPVGVEARIAWVCGIGQSNPDVSAFCFAEPPLENAEASGEPGQVAAESKFATLVEAPDPAPSVEPVASDPAPSVEPVASDPAPSVEPVASDPAPSVEPPPDPQH